MKYNETAEFNTPDEALNCSEMYDACKRELYQGEKDYTNLTISNYCLLFPVMVNKYDSMSFGGSRGWMAKNTNSGKYRILYNLNISQIYIKYCSNAKYFGMDYIDSDMNYTKFSLDQFKKELVEETNKLPEDLDFQKTIKKMNIDNIDGYIENIKNNLSYFKTLDSCYFNDEISRISNKYSFFEIHDLSSYKKCLYLIVLDEYKQFYVGKCVGGLKNRMRKHWLAKVIPGRQLWKGSFDYSRMKFDNFKMLDATRIFVCENIDLVLQSNSDFANSPQIECTSAFGETLFYENMDDLSKAERIVIDDCKCMFCLSDRPTLMNDPYYVEISKRYNIALSDIKLMHYLNIDEYKPLERDNEVLKMIERQRTKR